MNQPTRLVLSADQVPERQRLAYWREAVCEPFGGQFEWIDGAPLQARLELRTFTNQPFMECRNSAMRTARPRHLLDKGADGYYLGMLVAGEGRLRQGSSEIIDGVGKLTLCDTARPMSGEYKRHIARVLVIPRARLEGLLADPGRALLTAIPGRTGVGRLLAGHFGALWDIDATSSEPEQQEMLDVTCRLIALALGASARKIDGAHASLNLARREMALDLVRKSFTDPRFNARHAAARLGLSRRSLYRLFEAGELSFSECVRVRRLAQAYRLLATGDTPVTQAAFAAGFSDLSTFNRTFRARYGITPREVPLNLRDQAGQ